MNHPLDASTPAFLMNPPRHVSTDVPNNVWMEEMSAAERNIDRDRAYGQFGALLRFVSRYADVHLLPTTAGLQDQVYVANLGIALPHTGDPTLVLANFCSEPRRGETAAGLRFFEQMSGFNLHVAPAFFEGEADLKHIAGNVYIGARGIRTSEHALAWFERTFDMEVLRFDMIDPRLYHLDCCVMPLGPHDVAVCVARASTAFLRALERQATVHDVDLTAGYGGVCNSVMLGEYVLCASNLWDLSKDHRYYEIERAKVECLNALCGKLAREPAYFDLYEFSKSGAMLSCMMMHLNRRNFDRAATTVAPRWGPFQMPDPDGAAALIG
jgi:N-dimethylarginine dimethylaminohydrolase